MTEVEAARENTREAMAELHDTMDKLPMHYRALVGPYILPLWAAIKAINEELEARADDE